MLFTILTLTSLVLARQVEIKPNEIFEFYDVGKESEIYKFKYNTEKDVAEVSLYDHADRKIFTDTARSGAVYTGIAPGKRIRIAVWNKSKALINFSYKAPNPQKELMGDIGYVKDVDLVSDLEELLAQVISDQARQIERTLEHQKMVASSRYWARALLFCEVAMTVVAVYMVHKDFVSMFEKRQQQ